MILLFDEGSEREEADLSLHPEGVFHEANVSPCFLHSAQSQVENILLLYPVNEASSHGAFNVLDAL